MRHFQYKTLSELQQSAEELTQCVRFESGVGKMQAMLARKVAVGNVTLGNSMAIHPMEGCDSTLDGRPDELTWRRYERFARGGAKLIWFEATAVCEDGRANSRQLWINKDNVGDYARLHEMVMKSHAESCGSTDDLIVPLQLTHSGRYSYPDRIIAYHNPVLDRKTNTPADQPVISDDELERLEDVYVDAARLALVEKPELGNKILAAIMAKRAAPPVAAAAA